MPAIDVLGGAITSGYNAYFSFNVAHGKQYTVSVTNGAGGEPDLYLFDQSGIPVGYSAASGGLASLPAYQATYGGKLYVGVNAVDANVTSFDLSVSSNSAAVGNRDFPLINELYFESDPGAVEFFNPTASDIDMTDYTLDIIVEPGPITTTITLPAGSVVPANGFLVLFDSTVDVEDAALWRMCYAESTEFPSGWWYESDLEVILKDVISAELDMVLLNSATTAGTWFGDGFAASSSTVARDIADGYDDSDDSTDWINTYGTLGLPNDYTEDVDIIIELQ